MSKSLFDDLKGFPIEIVLYKDNLPKNGKWIHLLSL